MPLRWMTALFALSLVAPSLVAPAPAQAQDAGAALPAKVVFNRDVRPFLSDTCFKCHGPDANKRKKNLRLDQAVDAFAPRKGGTPIVPGKPGESEAYRRVASDDPDEQMPPPESGLKLSARPKQLFKRWVEQGAAYQPHWPFVPPARPELPAVKAATWPRNEIDRFILARLETERLSPSPQADRPTLIRRAALDLTGLPPTPEEVSAFVADASPGAYEKVVDRLLASPRYGERMAMQWLDGARYADSHGYQADWERYMWRWRYWVIGAFNENKPFDQFTVEQLVGDLLPGATTPAQRRNLRRGRHGGATPDDRLAYGYRLITSRPPDAQELAVLRAGFEHRLATYRGDADAAKKLLSAGDFTPDPTLDPAELAAYTMAANVMLNLDEAVTRE